MEQAINQIMAFFGKTTMVLLRKKSVQEQNRDHLHNGDAWQQHDPIF